MELDRAYNNLDNVEQMSGEISNVEQIDSDIDNLVQIAISYTGVSSDNIDVTVNNTERTISASLIQTQYASKSNFPQVGSDKLIYLDLSDFSLWRYDSSLADYVLICQGIVKVDTSTNWATLNPILRSGTIALESDTSKYKVGDGVSNWNTLAYYKHLTDSQATSLDILIGMLNNDQFGKVDDVQVNGSSVLDTSDKTAKISIGSMSVSDNAQSVPQSAESFTGSIVLHKVAKTGNYNDLIDKLVSVDNLNSSSTSQPLSANQGRVLKEMVQNLPKAEAFSSIQSLVTALNGYTSDKKVVGNDLYITATNVPDFWVSAVNNAQVAYTYTTDDDFINAIKANTSVQVGYFSVSMLETEKVDLTNYYTKPQINQLLLAINQNISDVDDRVTALSGRVASQTQLGLVYAWQDSDGVHIWLHEPSEVQVQESQSAGGAGYEVTTMNYTITPNAQGGDSIEIGDDPNAEVGEGEGE